VKIGCVGVEGMMTLGNFGNTCLRLKDKIA